jgi:opacity protein-like surface antigen
VKRRETWLAIIWILGFLNLRTTGNLRAGELTVPDVSLENYFKPRAWEGTAGAGVLFSPFIAAQNRPTLDYEVTEIQLGYMLTRVRGASFWRGNVEALASVFGGGIVAGRGNYVAGATAWLRYNFVPRAGHLVPFAQAGAGVTTTDLDRRIEGENFNFNLNLGVGARYFVSPRWSVNLEYRYQHISNDDLSSRNLGVNAHGPMVSVSHFF